MRRIWWLHRTFVILYYIRSANDSSERMTVRTFRGTGDDDYSIAFFSSSRLLHAHCRGTHKPKQGQTALSAVEKKKTR